MIKTIITSWIKFKRIYLTILKSFRDTLKIIIIIEEMYLRNKFKQNQIDISQLSAEQTVQQDFK